MYGIATASAMSDNIFDRLDKWFMALVLGEHYNMLGFINRQLNDRNIRSERCLLIWSRVGAKVRDLLGTFTEEVFRRKLVILCDAVERCGAVVRHNPVPTLLPDEMQFIQLHQNLVGNAIKYPKAGVSRNQISAAKPGGNKWAFSMQGGRSPSARADFRRH